VRANPADAAQASGLPGYEVRQRAAMLAQRVFVIERGEMIERLPAAAGER
jgi:hypothetical protein